LWKSSELSLKEISLFISHVDFFSLGFDYSNHEFWATYATSVENGWIHTTRDNTRVGMEDYPSIHIRLKGGKKRVKSPIDFRVKLRNSRVKQYKIKGKGNALD